MGQLAALVRAVAGFLAGLILGWGTVVVGFLYYAFLTGADGQETAALGMLVMMIGAPLVGLGTGVGLAALLSRRGR